MSMKSHSFTLLGTIQLEFTQSVSFFLSQLESVMVLLLFLSLLPTITARGEDATVPFNSWNNTVNTLQYGLAFIVVLVAAHPLGLFFPKYFKLPLITGYLVVGIIAGPFVTNSLKCCRRM